MARIGGLVALGSLLLAIPAGPAPAEPARPASPGVIVEWTHLGRVPLDDDGCASCPASFPTRERYVGFGIAIDSPFGTSLSGRFDVTCTDGATYHLFLLSPRHAGLFQIIPTSCVNLDTAKVGLDVTSVGLAPPDKGRTVNLDVYGLIQ